MFQRQDLGRFLTFEQQLGVEDPDYDPERETMAWMDMPTPLRTMTGMASDEQMDQLRDVKGTEADKLFLTLMQAHHLGGAHMADYEAKHGANPDLRQIATVMANNQRVEVKEYQAVLNRLNAS